MHFSTILAAIGAATLFAHTNAGVIPAAPDDGVIEARFLTSVKIVASLNKITDVSQQLQISAKAISIGSFAPVFVLVDGLNTIIVIVGTGIVNLRGTEPFTVEAEQEAILQAITKFVKVHQQLLRIVIGKSGLLRRFHLGVPIANVLQKLEKIVDTIAFGLIALFKNDVLRGKAGAQTKELDITIKEAITAYNA